MTFMEKLVVFFATLIAIFIFASIFVIPFTGFHLITGGGDHTGYITSVERTGVFWKTGTAYLKTSTQSTQEDAYCVTDNEVYNQLQADSITGAHINVHFHSYLATSVTECGSEGAIIDSVQTLN